MVKYCISGGNSLHGTVDIYGAKNAILPILAATILNKGSTTLRNCPNLLDVNITMDILRELGCRVEKNFDTIHVDSSSITTTNVPAEQTGKLRSSMVFLGALLSRYKEVSISHPGERVTPLIRISRILSFWIY